MSCGVVYEHMAGLAARRPYWPVVVLVIARDTAAELARAGWTKDKIRQAILKYRAKPLGEIRSRFSKRSERLKVPEGMVETTDPAALVPQPLIGQFIILHAGGPGEKSMLIPGWFGAEKAISREARLPANWDELLEKGAK
jgi:hypothetical protein